MWRISPAANGIRIVLEQGYDPTTTDFSSIITKIQQSGAQAAIDFSFGNEATNFYNAAAAATSRYRSSAGRQRRVEPRDLPARLPEEVGDVRHDDDDLLDPNTNAPKYNKYGAIMQQVFYHSTV